MKELTQLDVQNLLGGNVLRIAQMEINISEAHKTIEQLRAEIKRLNAIAESNTTSREG